jgi:hypothetical protein
MITKEQQHAIRIEQLKNEQSKTIEPLQLRLIREVEPRIRVIDNQIKELQKERNKFNAERYELHCRINSHKTHFELMIKAYQSLCVDSTGDKKCQQE